MINILFWQNVFHIGAGVSKFDFMAINIEIIKRILVEIKKNMEIVLSVDFKTSMEFFESGLNALQKGLTKTAVENMRDARKEAMRAMAIYKMKENQVPIFFYMYTYNLCNEHTKAEYILFIKIVVSTGSRK